MKWVVATLLVALAVASAFPLTDNDYQFLFNKWATQHKKSYGSAEELDKRFAIWKDNMAYISKHQSQPNRQFELKMNKFGDLSNEEFRAMYNHYTPNLFQTDRIAQLNKTGLPVSVNWVSKGVVTGVKDQGQCGSCWAFSTTGSVESAHAIATGQLVSLSEQELVDCSGSEGNQGCSGGAMQNAMQWIIDNNGICSEDSYPYQGVDGTCQSTSCQNVVTISSYTSVTPNSEDDLQAAVATQPVSIAVDAAGSDWQFYSGGILSDACGTSLDHGVLAVGYGSSSGQLYWLVKNSWGTGWGSNGYIYLRRGTGSGNPGECGIAMDPSFPTI